MAALIIVSILWAFSFGLIKGQLTGVNPSLVAFIRLLLCFVIFLPFFRPSLAIKKLLTLSALGACQFGLMYWAYIQSYQYLPGYLVAVFTIFTPFYVMLFSALFSRQLTLLHWLPVILSIAGAAVIVYQQPTGETWLTGIVILQLANIAFAFGQAGYKFLAIEQTSHASNMAVMFFGAALFSSLIVLFNGSYHHVGNISLKQWAVLVYLGVVASGLGFYLWNLGAKQVSPQNLAIMNNGYIPLAVIFSLTLFGESANVSRLALGTSIIMLSLWWSQRLSHVNSKK